MHTVATFTEFGNISLELFNVAMSLQCGLAGVLSKDAASHCMHVAMWVTSKLVVI